MKLPGILMHDECCDEEVDDILFAPQVAANPTFTPKQKEGLES